MDLMKTLQEHFEQTGVAHAITLTPLLNFVTPVLILKTDDEALTLDQELAIDAYIDKVTQANKYDRHTEHTERGTVYILIRREPE